MAEARARVTIHVDTSVALSAHGQAAQCAITYFQEQVNTMQAAIQVASQVTLAYKYFESTRREKTELRQSPGMLCPRQGQGEQGSPSLELASLRLKSLKIAQGTG